MIHKRAQSDFWNSFYKLVKNHYFFVDDIFRGCYPDDLEIFSKQLGTTFVKRSSINMFITNFVRSDFAIASYGKDTNAIFKSDKNNRGKCGLWVPTFPQSRLFGRLQIAVWEFIMNSDLALRIVWDQSDCRKVFHLIDEMILCLLIFLSLSVWDLATRQLWKGISGGLFYVF